MLQLADNGTRLAKEEDEGSVRKRRRLSPTVRQSVSPTSAAAAEELSDEQLLALAESSAGDDADAASSSSSSSSASSAARQAVSRLLRCQAANDQQRALFASQPARFMQSEAELHDAVVALSSHCLSSAAFRTLLLECDALSLLSSLLAHDNRDIANAAVGVLRDMLDDDSELHGITPADSSRQQAEARLSGDWLPAVIGYASSLSTEDAEDAAAVTAVLELLESLLDWWPALTLPVCRAAAFLPFVYSRLQRTQPDRADAQSLDCLSLLSICLQPAAADSERHLLCAAEVERTGGVLVVVKAVARYRRVDPVSAVDREYLDTLFDVCAQLLRSSPPTGCQQAFRESDGVLAVIAVLESRREARWAALRLLDHACLHQPVNVADSIQHGAIKHVAALLQHTLSGRSARHQAEMEEHVLSIALQWLMYAADTSLLRVINKFIERDAAKADRLVELLHKYRRQRARAGSSSGNDDAAADESQASRALACLRLCALLLAFLYTACDALTARIRQSFSQHGEDAAAVLSSLLGDYIRQMQPPAGEEQQRMTSTAQRLMQLLQQTDEQ